jgi:hypothetical protein
MAVESEFKKINKLPAAKQKILWVGRAVFPEAETR